jgi:hypothetical protein
MTMRRGLSASWPPAIPFYFRPSPSPL